MTVARIAVDDEFLGFADVGQAVCWALEVVRRRRLPKLSPLWREVAGDGMGVNASAGALQLLNLPADGAGRLVLALRVVAALDGLPPKARQVLELWALGDWADAQRLQAAWTRRQAGGVRPGARWLRYHLTYAELAAELGCGSRTAWLWVQAALARLAPVLEAAGVVQGVDVAADQLIDKMKKVVKADEFMNIS